MVADFDDFGEVPSIPNSVCRMISRCICSTTYESLCGFSIVFRHDASELFSVTNDSLPLRFEVCIEDIVVTLPGTLPSKAPAIHGANAMDTFSHPKGFRTISRKQYMGATQPIRSGHLLIGESAAYALH